MKTKASTISMGNTIGHALPLCFPTSKCSMAKTKLRLFALKNISKKRPRNGITPTNPSMVILISILATALPLAPFLIMATIRYADIP